MINAFVAVLALTGNMTNLEMVETVVSEALLPVAELVSAQGVEVLALGIQGEHEGGWLIEQAAATALGAEGVTVVSSREHDGWMLNIRPMELGVTYSHARRSWFLGGKHIPRLASCQVSATLVDPQGNIILTAREGAVLNDRVSEGSIVRLESSTERWVNGEISGRETGNILEPLVVTGVVTALVYLFYSSRN